MNEHLKSRYSLRHFYLTLKNIQLPPIVLSMGWVGGGGGGGAVWSFLPAPKKIRFLLKIYIYLPPPLEPSILI